MSTVSLQWLNENKLRLDPELFSLLSNRVNSMEFLPLTLKNKFTKVPILIQYHSTDHLVYMKKHFKYLGIKVDRFFKDILTISAPVTIHDLPKILLDNDIKKIYLDRPVSFVLDTVAPTIGATKIWNTTQNEGQGITIAVLDTGISPHPDLDSRIVGFHDLVRKKNHPYDDNGHGTHCAGCISGNGLKSNGLYRGMAPKSSLVGVKVLDKNGTGSISTVMAGIEWCIQNKDLYNIQIISLSLGSSSQTSYKDDPMCQIAEVAWNNGIIIVAAAGNGGPNEKTITSPGNHPSIITVGATDHKRTVEIVDDQIAKFSSRGPTIDGLVKPDLVAPGTNIISLRSKNSSLDQYDKNGRIGDYYYFMSGTSTATPIVAGVAALLLSQYPNMTPNEVKQKLIETCIPLKANVFEQGAGQVNVEDIFLSQD